MNAISRKEACRSTGQRKSHLMAIHSIRCEELENINLVSCEKDCEDIHSHPRQPVKMEPSSSYEHAQVRNHGQEGSSQRTSLSAGVSNEQLSAVTEECWQKSVSSGNELPVGQDAMEQSGTHSGMLRHVLKPNLHKI